MSTVRIAIPGGDETIVTLAGLSQRIPDERVLTVLGGLLTKGKAYTTLSDGQPAIVCWTDTPSSPEQQSLALLTDQRVDPVRAYVVDAQLSFELPGSVYCLARSASEAATRAKSVLRGEEARPDGFSVEIHMDEVEALLNTLEIAGTARHLGFGVQHVLVTGVHEALDGAAS